MIRLMNRRKDAISIFPDLTPSLCSGFDTKSLRFAHEFYTKPLRFTRGFGIKLLRFARGFDIKLLLFVHQFCIKNTRVSSYASSLLYWLRA